HAQPTACWACGPTVRLLAADGSERACADPVAVAAGLLRAGEVLAVKALGGYQIMVDPHDAAAVAALRARKERSAKPFALLARDAGVVARYAEVTDPERRLLESPGRPIVLLRARPGNRLSEEVAPGSSTLGFMLPATPLQHLLLAAATDVLIATSGNAPDEPMARTEAEALRVLGGVVGGFLTHDRPIHVRVDDSIARVVRSDLAPKLTFLRRARGYAPDPIPAPFPMTPTLSVGAELKDTVCVASGTSLYLSQHIGDLKTAGNREFFAETVDHLCDLFDVTPCLVASDLHPDFHSTHYAARYAADHPGVERILVQHHHAHMAACMADNGLDRRVIAVVFDGTGYGLDGTIWGGEFLVGDYDGFERAAHLERFRLPGGDQAVRHPWRVAAALLQQHGLPLTVLDDQDPFEVEVVAKMAARAVNSPVTSSMGRLFDAVSALLGVRRSVSYEAQAAIELEQLLDPGHKPHTPWPTRLSRDGDGIVISHEPWIRALAESQDEPAAVSSGRFHESVVQAVKEVCLLLRDTHGLDDVVLSGGVFLNQYLLVRVERELTDSGLRVHTHGRVPTNDGGISVGQAVIAAARKRSNNGQASPGKPRADGGTAQTVRADHRAVLRR
ncbi:MAG: carbamoyltransferase HypF, partial [Dactylosporangium sp.]|nr:carbamoyltransferase HypF [Dactylosporangium sp.]